MNIKESEEELFAEWSAKRPGFVSDGVVDEESYIHSNPRLVFVLKEVNDPGGGGWDLRQFVRDGGRAQTWNNVTRWVEGIRRLPEEIPWSELAEISEEKRHQVLKSIVAVNLKKSPGGHTSNASDVSGVADEDKVFLDRQFSLYDPDIIICCGTSDTFHWLVPLCEKPEWKSTQRGVSYHEYKTNKFIIAYSHPEARCASPLLYYGLVDAVREIKKKAT